MTPNDARLAVLELVRDFSLAKGIELRITLAEACADARMAWIEARAKALMPKDAQWNDLDRRTMLEGFVAEKERDYNFLQSLYDTVVDTIAVLSTAAKQ